MASSSAQNAPAQEESPALDLGQAIEKMIREIRNSLPVKAPSAQSFSFTLATQMLSLKHLSCELCGQCSPRVTWPLGVEKNWNINVAPESPGEDPMNRAAAEEASSGTESCRNSSPEPEEPDVPSAVPVQESCSAQEEASTERKALKTGQLESLFHEFFLKTYGLEH
ncbi:hypothetical protein DUI87_34047 [Hirundo rustica rustica]|uniref:Uncharacterized protein n=1 Tax=Hirundo rustica rustica TaxID=333673 RepID=A0A3M0ISV6_HIRRU|nr:hypothetical protein DUI87_34047 [Hirundo rustica rustica]